MTKYTKLTCWLNNPQLVVLSFKQIENIIDDHLPESAHKYAAWWGKDTDSEQCRAWRDAGWEVESVDLRSEEVVFRKGCDR